MLHFLCSFADFFRRLITFQFYIEILDSVRGGNRRRAFIAETGTLNLLSSEKQLVQSAWKSSNRKGGGEGVNLSLKIVYRFEQT